MVGDLPDVLSAILRALSFVLLFQAAGVAIFVATFGRRLAGSKVPVRRLGRAAALAAMVLVTGHYALEAARMAGEMGGIWDPVLQAMVWSSAARTALLCRLLGLALIAIGLRRVGGWRTIVAVFGAMLCIVAFTLTGHTSVSVHRVTLSGILLIHLLVVAFWFGALCPLYLASLRETPGRAFEIVARFTALATWLVPLILVAGTAMAVLLLPGARALSRPYGQLLIAKVAGFAVLMGLAAANKWRLGPALLDGTARGGRRFRRSLGAEYVLIAAVFTITAVMTSFFAPEG